MTLHTGAGTTRPVDNWFRNYPARQNARMRLICLPPAGGGMATFQSWRPIAPPWLELCFVQLAGRDGRIAEPIPASVDTLVAGLTAATSALAGADDLPYALFGHSMGGLLAYELAGRIEAGGGRAPVHVFVSASSTPGGGNDELLVSGIDDPAAFLRLLGGVPDEVWEYPELVELATGVLRADLQLLHDHRPGAHVLRSPLTLLYGTDDPVAGPGDVPWWRPRATGTLTVSRFTGGHFFLTEQPQPVLDTVARLLEQHVASVRW